MSYAGKLPDRVPDKVAAGGVDAEYRDAEDGMKDGLVSRKHGED